jgi:anion-transporting  ArsA/GET3 family ATPase
MCMVEFVTGTRSSRRYYAETKGRCLVAGKPRQAQSGRALATVSPLSAAKMSARKSRKNGPALVLFVTGKGGAGKTFVADALGRAAVARGLRTAVVSAAGKNNGDRGGTVQIRWTPNEALGRLLLQTVRLRFLANRLLDSSTFTAVVDAAPGVADLAFLALIDEIARDKSADGSYDLVVVDGPASGHSATALKAPGYIAKVAAVGPAAAVVARTSELIASPERFRPVLVCPPEELAVVETLAFLEEMRTDGIAPASVVANATYPSPGNEPQLRWLREHRVDRDAELYIARLDRQTALLDRLREAAPALCQIPRAFFEPPTGAIEQVLDTVLANPAARHARRPPA